MLLGFYVVFKSGPNSLPWFWLGKCKNIIYLEYKNAQVWGPAVEGCAQQPYKWGQFSVFSQTTSSKTLSLFASTRPGCSCLILLSDFTESRILEPCTFLYPNSLEYAENSRSTFTEALVFSSAIFPLFFLRGNNCSDAPVRIKISFPIQKGKSPILK